MAIFCRQLQNLCLIPIMVFIVIESIQLKIEGINYFKGWNISDFLFCLVFLVYYNMENFERTNGNEIIYEAYLPEMKLLIFFLAIAKLMQLIRFHDNYGILVNMILMCFKEL